MKKTVFILLLFVGFTAFSQTQQVSLRIDAHNLVYGSHANKPSLDYIISYSDVFNQYTHTRLGFFLEQFHEIHYIEFGAQLNHEFNISNKFYISPGIEVGLIYRDAKYVDYGQNSISYAFNLDFSYEIIDNLRAVIQLQKERADDVSQLWRNSAYSGLIYIF